MFEGSSFGHLESSYSTTKSIIKSNNKKMMNTTITSNTNNHSSKARATIPKAMVMLDDTMNSNKYNSTISATQDQSGITSQSMSIGDIRRQMS